MKGRSEMRLLSIRPWAFACVLCAGIAFLWCKEAVAEDPFIAKNDPRIAKIAAMLPEVPALPECAVEKRKCDIRLAERLLAEPATTIPDSVFLEYWNSDIKTDKKYVDLHTARRARLITLVEAEVAEGKGRFLGKIEEYLLSYCNQTSWISMGHDPKRIYFDGKARRIDLGSALMSMDISETVSRLRGRISPAVVERVKKAVRVHTIDIYNLMIEAPSTRHQYGSGWFCGVPSNNWTPACHREVVYAALACIDSREERARIMLAAAKGVADYIASVPEDGYCTEGIGYWDYGFGQFLALGLALRDASKGRLDIFSDPKAKKLMNFSNRIQVEPGFGPGFADSNPGMPNRFVMEKGFGVWPDLRPKGKLPPRDIFDVSQVYILRRSPSDGRTPFGIGFKGGHNAEFHNHNDVGSYAIFLGGREMVCDPGVKYYTKDSSGATRYNSPMRGSYGHPVPLPAGVQQAPGRQFCAKLVSASFADAKDIVTLDLAGAYPNVPGLVKLERTFIYDRAAQEVSVEDRVEFSSPQSFESPIITRCQVRTDWDESVFDLVTQDNARTLSVKVEATGGDWSWSRTFFDNAPRVLVQRHAVRFANPVTRASVRFAFRPRN